MIILFGVVGVLFMTRARATPASHKEQLTAVSNLPGLTEKGTKVYRRIRERFLMDKLECKQGEREQDESTQGEHDEVEGRFLEENLYIAYGSSALRLMYSKLQTRPSFPRHWFLLSVLLLVLLPREVRGSLVLAPGWCASVSLNCVLFHPHPSWRIFCFVKNDHRGSYYKHVKNSTASAKSGNLH